MDAFIALDLETTGLDPESDEIIEVGAVKFSQGKIIDRYQSLVQIEKQLSPSVVKLTGITATMLANAPKLNIVLEELKTFLSNYPLVMHNSCFDLSFLAKTSYIISNPCFDTLDLTKIVLPTLTSYRLSKLAEHLSLKIPSHRAVDDAEACGHIFAEVLRILGQKSPSILRHYLNIFSSPPSSLGDLLQKIYLQKIQLEPLSKVSRDFKFEAKGFQTGLFNKTTEAFIEEELTFEPSYIENLFDKESEFASNYPDFEFRASQSQMLHEICEAMLNEKFLIIEAATGTGKSLAYLLPAILWSLHKKEKVVISTHTINLQEQLLRKDLPLLEKALGRHFITAVIKGRNNYLCLRKWQDMLQNSAELSLKEKYFLARIVSWLQTSLTGDKNELNIKFNEQELWSNLASDSYTCLGKFCPWFENCFALAAKRNAEQANILITNHSLLLTDARLDNGVLPKHHYLIIDEAHNLEQEATNHLTTELASYRIKSLLYSLFHTKDKYSIGILATLGRQLKISDNQSKDAENTISNAINRVSESYIALGDFAVSLNILDKLLGYSDYKGKWLKPSIYDLECWPAIKSSADNLILRLKSLAEDLNLLSRFSEETLDDPVMAKNLQACSLLCAEYQDNAKLIFNLANQQQVTWLDLYRDNNKLDFIIKSAPIEIGPLLYERVLKSKSSVIFTSATLTIERKFSFFANQVGVDLLPENKLKTTIIDSTYNVAEQALLCIANNLPSPVEVQEEKYAQEIATVLSRLVKVNKGRALVLFTSHRLLRLVYYSIKDELEDEQIQLLGHQIDGSRTSIIEEFKKASKAVLLGANSFWEGIDIPGDALTLVIIVKLPFQSPSMPTLAARMEYLKLNSQDPFRTLNLPQAIIKFKQGFGRLIRSSKDRGAVVVLDKRLIEKNYGRKFLNSLPLATHFRGDDLEIAKFIAGERN